MDTRKFLAFFLIVAMLISVTACGNGQSQTPASQPAAQPAAQSPAAQPGSEADAGDGKVQVDGMLWAVEPLPQKAKLVVAYMGSTTPPLPTFVAEQKGWLDAVNLEVEMVQFANGPAQMEASSAGAWDVAATGIGGVITGVLGHNIKVLAVAARDEGLFQAFYARKDSDLVADGPGHGTNPQVYGKPETWKGKKILTAIGTTNHYTLYNTMLSLGLTLNDVDAVNMDVAAASNAFKAGEGDVVGVWGPLLYDDAYTKADSNYVLVSSDQMLSCGLVTNFVATPSAWDSKQQAVEKWLEMCMMAGEWCNDNLNEAAELFSDFNDSDGYDVAVETGYKIISENPFATLDENYGYYTKKNPDGERLIAVQYIYNPMLGYVDMGNYTQSQMDDLMSSGNFVGDAITNIYERVRS